MRPLSVSPSSKRIKGVAFEFDFDYDPAIRKMYFGAYEVEIIEVLKEFLNEGDTFIDVGANIGYITAVGAGYVGKSGQVHSFEPVPEYFQKLQRLAKMNEQFNITANQCALGDQEKRAEISVTNLKNIGWDTMVPGFMDKTTTKEILNVPVRRLDKYIQKNKLNNITMIKIDVEGFELPVLKGLEDFFLNSYKNRLPVIICEIAPAAYPRLGYKLQEIFDYMGQFSYSVFDIRNPKKRLGSLSIKVTTNVIFKVDL